MCLLDPTVKEPQQRALICEKICVLPPEHQCKVIIFACVEESVLLLVVFGDSVCHANETLLCEFTDAESLLDSGWKTGLVKSNLILLRKL